MLRLKSWKAKKSKVMKKNILTLIAFSLILTGTFSACTVEEDAFKVYPIKEGRFDLNENEYVTMQILPAEGVNNSSPILRIENHTEKHLMYGTPFSLEYFNKNNWESISLLGPWETIGFGLSASKTTEEQIYLFPLITKHNKGKKGRYRFTKNFSLHIDFPLGDDVIGGVYLSTEFEIR